MKVAEILGRNARTFLFSYPYNKKKGKSKAASKLATKKALIANNIPVPSLYTTIKKPLDLVDFDWEKLPSSFALKPNKGLGGDGIIIVKKRAKDPDNPKKFLKNTWITTSRKKVTSEDLKLHIMDILEGAYSIRNTPDRAFIEEYVARHKAFRKYAFRGTPDIRVIVFNKVPVMAMLRLPTKQSGGRANLHQGAIAVGIDITTGITTKSFWKGKYIRFKPDTKRKLHGIKIPSWSKILEIAVLCQEATGLGYLGVDIVLHPDKGPMVLELNYQPGLTIQLANKSGLKKRLERVEDLKVRDAEHGVKIAKALFVSSFTDRVKAEEGIKVIPAVNEITIKGSKKKQRKKVWAKMDTGAWRTSISYELAEELGLLEKDNILWTKKVRSSLGTENRPVINFTFWLSGRKIATSASLAKRMSLKYPVIVGRKDLRGFLVDPVIDVNGN